MTQTTKHQNLHKETKQKATVTKSLIKVRNLSKNGSYKDVFLLSYDEI